jgi:hypothetical protein
MDLERRRGKRGVGGMRIGNKGLFFLFSIYHFYILVS